MQYENDDYHPTSELLEYEDELGTQSEGNETEMQYYNEQFGPDDACSETITVDSQKKKYRKMWDDAKKVDKGFHKIKRKYKEIVPMFAKFGFEIWLEIKKLSLSF